MIRNIKEEDAKRISEIYSYYVLNTTISFEIIPPTTEEMKYRITEYTKNYPWLVYEIDGLVIGYAYANRFKTREAYKHTAELSVYFDKSHIHKGYGKALTKALLERLSGTDCYTAIVCIDYPNENSQRLFESLGFTCVGITKNVGRKFNRWLSVIDYYYQIQDYDCPNTLNSNSDTP